jgi:hypothetical protein
VRRPDRGEAETHLGDRVAVQPDDRTRRSYRIVTGATFHLGVRTSCACLDRQPDLGGDLGRANDRLEWACLKLAHRHDSLAARATDHYLRTNRTERGGKIFGGVGVAQRPADRASVPNHGVGNHTLRVVKDAVVLTDDGGGEQVGMADHRTDTEQVVFDSDAL